MILLASNFLEQWYLIYWPEEDSYSEVPPSKLVEPKKPGIGDKVRVKDRTKVHTGEVAGFGNKAEIEKLMLDLEGQQDDDEEETATEGEQGTCTYSVYVNMQLALVYMYMLLYVLKYICLIVLFNSSAHGCIEEERGGVETQQKTKKGNQPNLIILYRYMYIVFDVSYRFYTAKKRPREKTVSKKPPKKKAKTEG